MKDWFVKFNEALKKRVKFADDNTLAAEGIGDVSFKRKNGDHSLIKDMLLYISGIKCNLLKIGQLLKRNYKIHMKNKVLEVMNANGSLILKTHMA